ncbi:transcriptional regulator, TetR family [Proteiniborus ethanoligenes]|uniref:Transcriptional regulator, TetR family n=1 Tax=Proteiniborus ethanoligenes TaxID=415015 RepID=A0A1H3QBJ4_9FIRM|nr:TetR/AcrR family transcriptional regulator [Proteiniborus ethanoligenes]SDZ10501.1 transcriptional regulator, TetR family [Proteiniborus ethanoligenes]
MDKEYIYRQKILSCAKEILKADGEDALTISNIVQRCNISKSTFYNYFLSKEDLINHLNSFSATDGLFVSGTRDLIIIKAIEAISIYGLKEINMDNIANLVGINRTTIYNYFSSKRELWESCIRYEINKQKKLMSSIIQTAKNPIKAIEEYVDYLCNPQNKHINALIMISKYNYINNTKMQKWFSQIIDMRISFFTSLIKIGKQKGVFKNSLNPVSIANFFTVFLSGLIFTEASNLEEAKKIFNSFLYNVLIEDGSFENI